MCTCGNPHNRKKKLLTYLIVAIVLGIGGYLLSGCQAVTTQPTIAYPRFVKNVDVQGYVCEVWQRENKSYYLKRGDYIIDFN